MAKSSLPIALVLCAGSFLSACSIFQKTGTCDREPSRLSETAWNGESLAAAQVSLMFRSGPSDVTEAIGDYLSEQGIFAQFFVLGKHVESYEDTLEHLKEQGHLIGNGGYTGEELKQSADPVLELRKTDALISKAVTGDLFFLSVPDQDFDKHILQLLNRNGFGKYYGPIQSDRQEIAGFPDEVACLDSGAGVDTCAQLVADAVISHGKGLIDLQDDRDESLELVRQLVTLWRAASFEFVRLDAVPALRQVLLDNNASVDEIDSEVRCEDYE